MSNESWNGPGSGENNDPADPHNGWQTPPPRQERDPNNGWQTPPPPPQGNPRPGPQGPPGPPRQGPPQQGGNQWAPPAGNGPPPGGQPPRFGPGPDRGPQGGRPGGWQPNAPQPGGWQPNAPQPGAWQPQAGRNGSGSKVGVIIAAIAGVVVLLFALLLVGVLATRGSDDKAPALATSDGSSSPAPGAGSGSKGKATTSTIAPKTLPTSAWPDPALDAEPAGGDYPTKLKYALSKEVITAAGVSAPTSVTCDKSFDGSTSLSMTCNVAYSGVTVPFAVNVTGSKYYASSTYKATQLALTKAKAEGQLGYNFHYYDDIADYSCDMADVQLVDVGREGAVMCKVTHTDGKVEQQRLSLDQYGYVSFN